MTAQSTSLGNVRMNKKPLLVSHRGGRKEYEDNSASGFAENLAHGLRGFETDLHMTKDGEIVVMHNNNLDFTTTGFGLVEDMTRDEISQFRLKKTGDRIPYLDDLLEIFKGRDDIHVEFEMKSNGSNLKSEERLREYCQKIHERVSAAMPTGTYTFTSFCHDTLEMMRSVDADTRLGLIMDSLREDDIAFAKKIGAVRLAPEINASSNDIMRKAADLGFETTLWMVQDVAAYEKATALGATATTSDYPIYVFSALQKQKKVIAIVGSGMMGSALAFPARENGNEVRLVGTHLDREIIDACRATGRHPKFKKDFPYGVKYYQMEELEEALKGVDFVVGGVSSFGVDWFHEYVLPKIPENVPVLSVTKGLVDNDDGSLICYPEYWERKLAEKGLKRCIFAIGGPCTSYELVAHDQTEVYFCGHDADTLRMLRDSMTTPYYHPSISTDVRGVESAVALKNGYALGITLTIGINQREFGINSEIHYNSQAAAFQQGVKEMQKLIKLCGGKDDKILVGAGDLYVTVYGGRTRLVGILLGRGYTMQQALDELKGVTLESLVVATRVARAVRKLAAQGKLDLIDFPLLMAADDVINGGKGANLPWNSFTVEDI